METRDLFIKYRMDPEVGFAAFFMKASRDLAFWRDNIPQTSVFNPIESLSGVTATHLQASVFCIAANPFCRNDFWTPAFSMELDWETSTYKIAFLDSCYDVILIRWINVKFECALIEEVADSTLLDAASSLIQSSRNKIEVRKSIENFKPKNTIDAALTLEPIATVQPVSGGAGRAMTYNHPAVAAKTALKLSDAGRDLARPLTLESVQAALEQEYISLHGRPPTLSTLEYAARGVLNALRQP